MCRKEYKVYSAEMSADWSSFENFSNKTKFSCHIQIEVHVVRKVDAEEFHGFCLTSEGINGSSFNVSSVLRSSLAFSKMTSTAFTLVVHLVADRLWR